MNILIVEDEERLGEFLRRGLSECAFAVTLAGNCGAARAALHASGQDLVLLDLGLPDGDGMDLLHEWRTGGFTAPVLIMSARDTVEDRIQGFEIGADDYLPKPFSLEELLARARALLRRQSMVQEAPADTVLEHRGIRLDVRDRSVQLDGRAMELTSREFALLEIFMNNVGRILSRTLISEKIWDSHYAVDTNLLDVYMSKLRGKLESGLDQPLFKTVRGVGYQLL